MTVQRLFFALFAVLFALAFSGENARAQSDEPIHVIVNNSLSITNTTLAEVKRIFRKEATAISGVRVVPINAPRTKPLRAAFVQRAYGTSVQDELATWEKLKITNGLQPPTEIDNTLKAVFSVKNGISYCFQSDYKPGTAKIILTF